jgi:L-lactate dehydrogenase complex protein LldF
MVVLAGVDTVLPSLNDAELILALQAGYASANGTSSLLKIITSAKQDNSNSSNDIYILLVDNGKSNLLETEQQRQSLYCIQCGACQALCPVVSSIGSTGADDVHSGPLAFASLPQWKGKKDFSYQSYSSPLCGKCNEVCPVKIDFRKAMLATRHDAIKSKLNSQQEKLFYFFWKKTMLKREFINWNNINAHRKAVETIFLKSRTGLRKLPVAEAKSFNQQWRERLGIK